MHASIKIAIATGAVGSDRASITPGTNRRTANAGPSILKALDQTIRSRNPATISVDLFDTILLRGSEPQRLRWYGAARRAEALLKAQEISAPATSILACRLTATRAAMSMTAVFGGPEDVTLNRIFTLMVEALALPTHAAESLHQAEIAEEQSRLTPNTDLLQLLASHRLHRRIVITSDTNFSAPDLALLLNHTGTTFQFDTIRTSSDMGLTKQRGSLFPALIKSESINESRILHIGDDEIADVQMASRHGIAPFHLPRPRGQLLIRRARKYATKVIHGDR